MDPILEKYYVLDEGPGLKANCQLPPPNAFGV